MLGTILLLLSYINLSLSPKTNQDVGDHFTVTELHQPISVTKDQSGCWGPFYCYWVTSTYLCHQRPIRMLGTILLLLSYINLSLSPKTNQDVGDHFTVIELHQPISVTKDQSGCWGPFYCCWVTSMSNQDVGDHFTVTELHQSSSDTEGHSGCWGPFYCDWITPKTNQDVGDHFTVIELHQSSSDTEDRSGYRGHGLADKAFHHKWFASVSEDLKCWGARDTKCGLKAEDGMPEEPTTPTLKLFGSECIRLNPSDM